MSLVDGNALISAAQLAEVIDDPRTRIFDCSVDLQPRKDDASGGSPYRVVSGRERWLRERLPNAGFLDLPGALSDPSADTAFMRPPAAEAAASFAAAGVVDDARIVLYAHTHPMWSTRVWWMLRGLGVRAALLDGGLAGWRAAGLPVASGPFEYEPGELAWRPWDDVWADADAVAEHPGCTLNALSPSVYRGDAAQHYGRPGHIPSSLNLPYRTLLSEDGQFFASSEQISRAVADVGAGEGRTLCYCGGGISATILAFALHRLGQDDVAVYDGSLAQWCRDPERPLVTGVDA